MHETIEHYQILAPLGSGGIGEVYRARDTRLGRTVAIKLLSDAVAAVPARREQFLREARAAMALSHPNIAALYEIGEHDGRPYLVFEYVPGETLKTMIGGSPLHPRRVLELAIQLADALAAAHAEGIVHRDLKPDNIIVTPKGNAKFLDVGLSTWTRGGAEREAAATTIAEGASNPPATVAYLSPEQALGEPVDQRTDIFSLGIVLFEMLTGKLPFNGPTSTALALQIVQAPAPSPSTLNPGLPPELDAVLQKALAKSLDNRYGSAATLAADLRTVAAVLDARGSAHEAVSVPALRAPARRSYAGWIVVGLIVGALIAAAWLAGDTIRRAWRRTMVPVPAPVMAVMPFGLNGPAPSTLLPSARGPHSTHLRRGPTPGAVARRVRSSQRLKAATRNSR